MKAPRGSIVSLVALLTFLSAIFIPSAPGEAASPQVIGVRHSSNSGRTRVVVELSREAKYRVTTRTNPDRIVVDIPGANVGTKLRNFAVEDSRVKCIRLNRLRRGAQVVIDLPRRISFDHFSLPPSRDPSRPDRIVLDVGPGTPRQRERDLSIERGAGRSGGGGDRERTTRSDDVVVVIDPGHGGVDGGAIGPRRLAEKTVNLRVARALYQRLKQESGIIPRLTRTGDETVSLSRRQEMVEEFGGDLLVSIHVNSSPNRKAKGSEVFYLSLGAHEQEATRIRRKARKKGDDLAFILGDLRLEEGMLLSGRLADRVGREMDRLRQADLRKVKQAGFQVLKLQGVPSVLVEIGFFSNSEDARWLSDPSTAERVAEKLSRAITSFVRDDLGARPSALGPLARVSQ